MLLPTPLPIHPARMRLSRLCCLTPNLLRLATHRPSSYPLHFIRPLSSSPPSPAHHVPFIDNVATLFNVSALSSKERPLHATIIHTNGSVEQRDLDRRTLKMETGLAGRDIRVIDGELSSATSILPRARSIVVNFNSIRAVILHNRAAFIMPLSPASLDIIPVLQERLRDEEKQKYHHSPSRLRHPFEFHVLECLLLVSCRHRPAPCHHPQLSPPPPSADDYAQAVGAARARAGTGGGGHPGEGAVHAERHVEPVSGRARDAEARAVRCVLMTGCSQRVRGGSAEAPLLFPLGSFWTES